MMLCHYILQGRKTAQNEAGKKKNFLRKSVVLVPADLGIAGFDDINYAHLTVPKLTTIHQNMERKAELAVTELLSAIQNPIYMGKEVLLDVMLIARDSI